MYTYDYYKLDTSVENKIFKTIYLYIYEPITFATFDSTMLYKYDYNNITNQQLRQQYGEHTLNINLNNNDQDIFNYADVKWHYSDEYISNFELETQSQASFRFDRSDNLDDNYVVADRIIATLTQFGVQYPIYCNYEIRKPILSDSVELNTTTNAFSSGNGYINLKVGESVKIDATAKSQSGKNVSFEGFEYVICSSTGYALNGVASVDSEGLLTATGAGRVKLIIIAKDRLYNNLSSITNYFNTKAYIQNNASYIIVDIIVSDGSEENPYLIASGDDFRKIAQDFNADKINNYHYALVNNITLGGKAISFDGKFNGSIKSFDENRYTIYGIILNEKNPTLFNVLGDDSSIDIVNPRLKNIDFYVDVNYVSTVKSSTSLKPIMIGLIGENYALIENITVTISGNIDANNIENIYTIGSMVVKNYGKVVIDDNKLIGVQGDVLVKQSALSRIVLGGVIGENQGTLIGANTENEIDTYSGEVEYEVYYDNQGATADINLQVYNVSSEHLNSSAVGGVIGYNNEGLMSNVYSMGTVKGVDSAGNLSVNNIGGLIGKNTSKIIVETEITSTQISGNLAITAQFNSNAIFQINNSYSSAQVKGDKNVGGAVGYDYRGSYKKVYYEIYAEQNAVRGNQNVGGLIGYAEDSNLYYCYSTNFAWNYANSVKAYDIVGDTNVGGLIGLAQSSRYSNFVTNPYTYSAMNVVSSLASVSLSGTYNVSGLVGRLNNYGVIYVGYYYGVIDESVLAPNTHPIVKMYQQNILQTSASYNNVYWIITNKSI